MAKGRGSAVVGAVMVCLLLLQYSLMARAAVYIVGGAQGWTFNLTFWPKGKHFRPGDIVVFNYNRAAHSVVAVNRVAYNHCMSPRDSKLHRTGKDKIKPAKGQNYFICSLSRQCKRGMKIHITAV